MEVSYEEQPPKYSQASENHASTASAAMEIAPPTVTTGIDATEQTGNSEGRENIVNQCTVMTGGEQNTTEYHMGKCNASNSFSGFIDVLYQNKKLPWRCEKNLIYKLGLLVYFLANFAYSIIAIAKQKEHLAFYFTYTAISLIASVDEIAVMIMHIKKLCIVDTDTEEETELLNSTDTPMSRVRKDSCKAKRVVVDYMLSSLGEFLIYPVLIYTLYGFINERAWRLDNGISGCNFVFFLYSVIMVLLYMNTYVTLLVARVGRAAYVKYDELVQPTEMEWKRYITPVYMTIVFAFMTALTHWFMIGIIGVRIYVDNFTPDKDDTNNTVPDTGGYKLSICTGIMIVCTICLPIISWITYIILNKLWFFEVYSAINEMSNAANHMPARHSWNKKILASLKDPLAYVVIVLLMLPFVAFTAGTYLLDYYVGDYEVASDARNAIQKLGLCFIVSFVLTNLQAIIISAVAPVLCVVSCYKKCITLHLINTQVIM